MLPICLHFEKTVKGCQYGYQMKGLDLVLRTCGLSIFVFQNLPQNPMNMGTYPMKAHEKITNKSFCLDLHFVNINKTIPCFFLAV